MNLQKAVRLLSLVLSLVLLIQLLPPSIASADFGDESITADAEATLQQDTTGEIDGEVVELRTETEKHYRLTDGSYVAVNYGQPVHYLDSDQWVDIDNTLEETTIRTETLYSAVNGVDQKYFNSTFNVNETLFSVQHGSYYADMALLEESEAAQLMTEAGLSLQTVDANATRQFSTVAAQISNPGQDAAVMTISNDTASTGSLSEQVSLPHLTSSVLYENILPNVDLSYTISGRNIKEYIVVKAAQSSYVYRFRLSLNGLTPISQTDGSILLCNADGEAIYEIPVPYMEDASGQFSYAVSYSVANVGNGNYVLTVTADSNWINDAERTFPVLIDPALIITVGSTVDDIISNFVKETHPDEHKNGSQLYLGNMGGDDKEYIIYSYFKTLPSIPENCSVVGATFSLFKMDYDGPNVTEFYGQLREVTGSKPASYTSYQSWILDITANTAPEFSDIVEDHALVDDGPDRYVDWDISRVVSKWYTQGTENRTIAITPYHQNGFPGNAWGAFFIHGQGSPPLFIVHYRNNVGLNNYYTYQSFSAGRAGVGYLCDPTSQLTLANTVVSSSSNTLSFALTLYHNTANRNQEFLNSDTAGIHTVDYSAMKTGAGWKLSVQESVKLVTVATRDASNEYYVYNDSDGSEHYFLKTGATAPYSDEDGLGLKLSVSGSTITLTDKQDNYKEFYNGYLTKMGDANGNAVYLLYNGAEYSASSAAWKPTSGTANKVTKIVRINDNGSSADVVETLFTLSYSNNRLNKITDSADRETTFTYTTADSVTRLTKITYPDGETAEYSYSGTTGLIFKTYDSEQNLGIAFEHEKFYGAQCVQSVREFSATSISGTETMGNKWHLWATTPRMREYRFYGPDQALETADDTVVRYTFDHTGKTINVIYFNTDRSQILSVSNSAYTSNTNNLTKNRISASSSAGYIAVNLLTNGGVEFDELLFESDYDETLATWKRYVPQDIIYENSRVAENLSEATPDIGPRTGEHLIKTFADVNKAEEAFATSTIYSTGMYQEVYLTANTSYTFSGWANSAAVSIYGENGGLQLQFRDSSGNVLASSILMDFAASRTIEDGWTKLQVNYTPTTTGWYQVIALQHNAFGTGGFDDLQLEENKSDAGESAASSSNLVHLGSFELWNENGTVEEDWTGSSLDTSTSISGASMCITGSVAAKRRASQTIPINLGSNTTFVLSGWGKATASPACAYAGEMTGDNSGNERFFGLIAKVNYTDGTASDYHYVPFDCNYTDWQYASGTVAPKQKNKTIDSITVSLCYDYNANTAWFDNISLVKEPSQTYTYDNEGNLTMVTVSGNSDISYTYDGADVIGQVAGGYGSYSYTYDDAHNLTAAVNDGVKATVTYDAAGNTTGTALQKENGTGRKVQTSATYTGNGNYTASVTDSSGSQVFYTYDDLGRLATSRVLTAATVDASPVTSYTYDENTDRQLTANRGTSSLHYLYGSGQLFSVNSYNATNSTTPWQSYQMPMDAWGNTTGIYVHGGSGTADSVPVGWNTGIQLAAYEYSGNNGYLSKMTYGNGDSLSYIYDRYGRVTQVAHKDDTDSLLFSENYVYDGNGNITTCTILDSLGAVVDLYRYEYDSLGRLIRSYLDENGGETLRTEHLYDADNRLTGQSYQIQGGTAYTESYTYNNDDGSLATMTTTDGDTLTYSYDDLKRLSSVTGPEYTRSYTYRNISDNLTTFQVSSLAYTGLTSPITFDYTYTPDGNIATEKQNTDSTTTYVYDDLGQLLTATHRNQRRTYTYTYTYDALGNILTADVGSTTDTYTYGNVSWPSLLTEYNGNKIAYEGQTYTEINRLGNITSTVTGTAISGNPVSYYNNGTRWDMEWEDGRNLVSISYPATTSQSSREIVYEYDSGGKRVSKTDGPLVFDVGGDIILPPGIEPPPDPDQPIVASWDDAIQSNTTVHAYIYAGDNLIQETITYPDDTTKTLHFAYDASGAPYSLTVDDGETVETYYYITNLQGDVVQLVDGDGAVVASYTYDPYGKVLSATGDLAELNPLRYRGYYADEETGFYYLGSRYYDPEIRRFINADVLIEASTEFDGINLFAYCGNNPVFRIDASGAFWKEIGDFFKNTFGGGVKIITNYYDKSATTIVDYLVVQIETGVKTDYTKNIGNSEKNVSAYFAVENDFSGNMDGTFNLSFSGKKREVELSYAGSYVGVSHTATAADGTQQGRYINADRYWLTFGDEHSEIVQGKNEPPHLVTVYKEVRFSNILVAGVVVAAIYAPYTLAVIAPIAERVISAI